MSDLQHPLTCLERGKQTDIDKGVGYVRICDRICYCIFCQNSYIAYFFTYNGIFKIAYAKIMLHIQKFTYIRTYAAYFRICDHILKHFSCSTLF